jgi:aspartyl-tRNA synthetase
MQCHERSCCGTLNPADAGASITLAGWVDALRDHGEVLFIHLRDRTGIVQVVFTPEGSPRRFVSVRPSSRANFASRSRAGSVNRAQGTENPGIATGAIEVVAAELTILCGSAALPFLFRKSP